MNARNSILACLCLAACTTQPRTVPTPVPAFRHSLVPLPASVELDPSQSFAIDSFTTVYVDPNADSSVESVGQYTAKMLWPATKLGMMRATLADSARTNVIRLKLDSSQASLGDEGYELRITPAAATISARTAAGLFHGVQTIRQLLPPSIENPAAVGRKLRMPAGHIVDTPRYEWRGMMLDVSRHFLGPKDIERFIDLLALYKMNRLHLHLADDQGWRIEIKSHPSLTQIGGSSQVGGPPGGFYTQEQYKEIVSYAASRFITIVPEIDMPGHTNAALASIPELNCDNVSPPIYTGIRVGFSALCVDSARIYPILDDIVKEISSLTPGPYFHIGGDEVMKLTHPQYLAFIEKMQGIVNANGKRMIGWGEISPANLSANTIVQNWKKDSSFVHAARGGRIILSPSSKIYLDQQYDTTTILGLHWAGYSTLRNSYDWDPAQFIPGVPDSAVLGVEGPLWAESLIKVQDYEYMAFPRAMAVAEMGWSRQPSRTWDSFDERAQLQRKRLQALGVNAGF